MTSVGHRGGAVLAGIRAFLSGRGTNGFGVLGRGTNKVSSRGATVPYMQLFVSGQNNFFTDNLSGATGDVCTISGTYLYDLGQAPTAETTWVNYQAKTQADIETRLSTTFLAAAPTVSVNTRGLLVLDMEGGPTDGHNSHPNHLWQETASDRAIIIAGWRKRIAAVRSVFPYARVAMYGVAVPDQRGIEQSPWTVRLPALVEAGTAGAFDDLDYIMPVLYVRWGPSDLLTHTLPNWTTIPTMVTQGMVGSRTILDSSGHAKAVLPFLTTYVANASSTDSDLPLFDLATVNPMGYTWGQQFDTLRSLGQTEAVVWVGGGNTQVIQHDSNNNSHYTVNKYMQAAQGLVGAY